MSTNDPLHPYPGTLKHHNVQSAEEQAAERYPTTCTHPSFPDDRYRERKGFSTCLTERAIPAEQKLEEALNTIQVLVDALAETRPVRTALYNICQRNDDTRSLMSDVHRCDDTINAALSLASEKHGIKPSIQ